MKIQTIDEYVKEIKEIYSSLQPNKHLFFRGHSKKSYLLKPTIFRKKSYKEKDILFDFKHYAPYYEMNYDFVDDRDKMLADMQHYGLPTRLLDWTLSPLNALFFACGRGNTDEDGEVIIFDPWRCWKNIVYDQKEPEIHQIHIMSRALLSGEWGFDKIKKYIKKKFNYSSLGREDIKDPFPYISSYTNDRILHQRGCFTIHGTNNHEIDKIPKISCYIVKRISIAASRKSSLLEELNCFYINDYSVFPDFEGMKNLIKIKSSLFNVNV